MILQSPSALTVQPSSAFSALAWIEQVLLGPLGTSIAVIAVTWFGFEMLTGRLSVRRGGLMVLGCFIFFGAPELARELVQLARGSGPGSGSMAPQQPVVQPAPAPKNPPPFDPYAGASVPN